ncbi:MAG: hypothetical protein A2X75_04630 [Gallionellales bacterium GWE2_58_10]|nr:MAG: hypothetical protein A2X75_04630 [Gallionellales bacterium GWE2_58_10]
MADGMTKGGRTEGGGLRVGAAAPRLIVSVACLLMPVFCCAGELADPTRLPAILAEPVAAVSGATESQPARLTSIIISTTRRAAIIDGETVELGDKHGNDRLIEVNEGGVVLKGAQGRQVLTLFPDVKMVSKRKVKAKSQSTVNKVQADRQMDKPVAHKGGK